MQVRFAQPSDVAAIHGLIEELANYERAPDAVINTPNALAEDLFQHNRCKALVVEQQGQVVAFALYYFGYSSWKGRILYLEDIYVKEPFRNGGIGQLLFDRVVAEAKIEKVRRMDWQVLFWNEPALAFYRKNKAILDDEWVNGRLFFHNGDS
ncbi:MAG: GNAT family N-acetyltransferase [Bacteroidetes bacterium]|nr:GNAT family N-acetyltransferase [Bacteroidota bacterium]